MTTVKIALLGDQSNEVIAHRAIPPALQLAARQLSVACSTEWVHSSEIEVTQLAQYHGLWCVPASPYANAENIINAIQYARENRLPLLGTCGGYQHMALEFARNVLGYSDAGSAEDNPDTTLPLINAMFCELREKPGQIQIKNSSFLYSLYQTDSTQEEYNCGFGLNTDYLHIFDGSNLSVTGFDNNADPRAVELNDHPFYIGTAFQPERSALIQQNHPIITGFLQATINQFNH